MYAIVLPWTDERLTAACLGSRSDIGRTAYGLYIRLILPYLSAARSAAIRLINAVSFSLARHVSAYGVLRHAMCPRIGWRASLPRRCGCQNGTDQALWAPRPTLVEDLDHPGDWRVEYFDSDAAYYITIFMGRMAEARARDYFEAMTHGVINNRIADAQARGPFKLEWTHTASPRRSADAGSCVRRIQRSTPSSARGTAASVRRDGFPRTPSRPTRPQTPAKNFPNGSAIFLSVRRA
jgi:hypothetical protein